MRSRAERQEAFASIEVPLGGFSAGEEYRRYTTLASGGDPDDLVCVVCGKKVTHEEAHIVIGVIDADHAFERFLAGMDFDRKTLPPCAYCPEHNSDEEKVLPRSVERMPVAARSHMKKLMA